MKTCPTCQAENANDANFCGSCGASLIGTPASLGSTQDLFIHTTVGGRYLVQEKIGSGGMGDVYLATHNQVGQKVAIKFLASRLSGDAKIVQRFFNEARAIGRLTHPGVVTLNDFGQTDDGTLYIIMEYIEGEVLSELIAREKALPTETAVNIILQLCDVLDAAHSQGIIHRDLKPDNIMLTPGRKGRHLVKVLDFGIAKLVSEESGLTQTGTVYGTPEFMSPEQATGHPIDGRADLYAVACILYYMLVGRPPFFGDHPMAVMRAQASDPPKPPRVANPDAQISHALEAIILKAMSKVPEDRHPSIGSLADEIEGLQLMLSGSMRALPPGRPNTGEVLGHSQEQASDTTSARRVRAPSLNLALDPEIADLEAPDAPASFDGNALGKPDMAEASFGPASFGGLDFEDAAPSFDLGLGQEDSDQFFDESSLEIQRSALKRSSKAPMVIVALVLLLGLGGAAFWWTSQSDANTEETPEQTQDKQDQEPTTPPEAKDAKPEVKPTPTTPEETKAPEEAPAAVPEAEPSPEPERKTPRKRPRRRKPTKPKTKKVEPKKVVPKKVEPSGGPPKPGKLE